ncbi:MAG: DUF2357 domain-containing protein [Clostridia bacterium]|nr:DUF2357 domain-containing protein [Clostridia bacterium]
MAVNIYEKIVYEINNLIKQEDIYPKYVESISSGKNDFKISQVYSKKNYSSDWIATIEDCVVSLDNIVRNPRKFIVIEEDIVDISLARSISVESVKHLSQHTNLISSVDKNGTVIPSKILNTSKEESFDIYENRFIYTLLLKLRDFIERRFQIMQNAALQSGELGVEIQSDFSLNRDNKVSFKLESNAKFPFNEFVKKKSNNAQPTDIERISHIKMVISDFLGSPFAREMRSCALVRPPIQRTNVILKNPDFKKALVLWQFIETAENMEFSIDSITETVELPDNLADKYRGIIFLNTVLLQSIASTREETESVAEAEKREKIEADEYITKNIDNFVPDDYPLLKLEINEIRYIYQALTSTDKALSPFEITKINSAIDRVLRQYNINKLEKNDLKKKQLILQQQLDERKAKVLALREKRELERKERAEKALARFKLKQQEYHNQLEIDKLKELQRLEAEEKEKQMELELQRQKEEKEASIKRANEEYDRLSKEQDEKSRYLTELKEIQKQRIEHENYLLNEKNKELVAINEEMTRQDEEASTRLAKKQEEYDLAIAAFKAEEDRLEEERRKHVEETALKTAELVELEKRNKSLDDLAHEKDQKTQDIHDSISADLIKLKQESDKYWADQLKLLTDNEIEMRVTAIQNYEDTQRVRIIQRHQQVIKYFKLIQAELQKNITTYNIESLQAIVDILAKDVTNKQAIDAAISYDKARRKRMRRLSKRQLKKLRQAQEEANENLPEANKKID